MRNYLLLNMNGSSDSDEVKSIRGINTRLPLSTPVAISASMSRFRIALTNRRVPLHKPSLRSKFLTKTIDANRFNNNRCEAIILV